MERLRRFLFEKDELGQRFWERDIIAKKPQATPVILASLCRQISFMLGSGVSLKSSLMVLLHGKKSRVQHNLQNVLDGIMSGESLSHALEKTNFFPMFMCNMCRIGEMSDNLPAVMALLADYYEEMSRNHDEIKAALLYPAIVSAMMLAMILVAVLYVLPSYAMMFEASDVPLPALTRGLLAISGVLLTRWWIVLPVTLLIIAVPIAFVRTERGRSWLEFILLYTPPVSIVYRRIVNLHILQAMSLLLQSGQPLPAAILSVSGIMPNKLVANDLQEVAAGLQEGETFWVLLANIPYIDQIVIGMARVGEETGNMAQVFEHASGYSRYQFQQMSKKLNKMVEPTVTLILGLVLALVMLSIILPTFAMTEFVGY